MGHLIELWNSLGYSGQLAIGFGLVTIGGLAIASKFVPEMPLTAEEQAILARPRPPKPDSDWLPWALIPAFMYVGILAIAENEEGPPVTFWDKFWVAFLWVVVGVLGGVLFFAEPVWWILQFLWTIGLLKVLWAFATWAWGLVSEAARYANEASERRKGWLD